MTQTSELIHRLGREAGQGHGRPIRFGTMLLAASALAFALSLGVILLVFHASMSIAATLGGAAFWYKTGLLAVLAAGAFLVTGQQAVPGSGRKLTALLPGLALPLLGAALNLDPEPVLGHDWAAVPECFGAILLASLPALVVMLIVLRRGVVTRPAAAGAAAGLLAGALGGAAYAIACRNNGSLFFLVWYGFSIFLVTLAGAGLGRWQLRW